MEKAKRRKRNDLSDALLYLLTPPEIIDPEILIPMVVQAVRAGADIIQLRNKSATTRELIDFGHQLCEAVHREGALFFVNDRVDVALATGADGVHLGQDDLPVRWARRILKSKKRMIIGVSTHSIQQAMEAEFEGADYIGFGPIFATPAKSGYPPLGTGFFKRLNESMRIPYFAIGGIHLSNMGDMIQAGVKRVAICSGIFGQKDIANATSLIKKQFLSAKI